MNEFISVASGWIVWFEIASDGHDAVWWIQHNDIQLMLLTGPRLDEQHCSFSGHHARILTKTNDIDYITYSCVVCVHTVVLCITVVSLYPVQDVMQRNATANK